MNKETMQIETLKDGRSAFSYWHDDTLIIIQPLRVRGIKGFKMRVSGVNSIIVRSQLPRAERTAVIRQLLAKEVEENTCSVL